MKKIFLALAILMLIMCALLIFHAKDTIPGAGLIFSISAALTALCYFPVLVVLTVIQKEEPMAQLDRVRIVLLALLNATYTGLLFASQFTEKHFDVLQWARIAAVLGFISFLPWLIARFDHPSVRWFMGSCILFYAVSAI